MYPEGRNSSLQARYKLNSLYWINKVERKYILKKKEEEEKLAFVDGRNDVTWIIQTNESRTKNKIKREELFPLKHFWGFYIISNITVIICDTHLFGVIQLVILFRLDHTLVFLHVNIYKKKKMQSIELANDCAVELTPVRAILLLPTLYLLVELLYVIGKTFFFSLSLFLIVTYKYKCT